MESTGKRIRVLREKLGISQQQLAEMVGGVSRGAVGNWELGRGIKFENLARIAKVLGVGVEWLSSGKGEEPSPIEPSNVKPPLRRPPPDEQFIAHATVPAYGQAMGGDDGFFVLNGNKIADVLAPPSVSGVRDAYAVYVAGDSMEPRYEAGEVVFVNPNLPVRRGDYVVVQVQVDGEDVPRGYIKRFLRMSDDGLVLQQFNPAKDIRFNKAAVVSVHRVVASAES